MIPLKKSISSITVPAADVTLLTPLYERDHRLASIVVKDTQLRYEKLRELNRKRIMTSPFRTMKFLLWKLFRGFRSVFSSEKFVFMRIKGKGVWKLNTNAAWALQDGKVIDKLVDHVL